MVDDRYLLILDPGHGVETSGKRSPIWEDGRQLFEYEFNQDISNRIRLALHNSIYIVETREDEHDISLHDRVVLANSFNDSFDKVLFLSIHANAGGGTGWEIFTSKGQDKSDKYADIFFEEAQKEFPLSNFRKDTLDGDSDKEANFYVLRNTKMPAILTENFFMDTLEPDCMILMSEEGRQKIANLHINAIRRILKIWNNE